MYLSKSTLEIHKLLRLSGIQISCLLLRLYARSSVSKNVIYFFHHYSNLFEWIKVYMSMD